VITTGVELTDTTLRFVVLTHHGHSIVPGQYAELALPEGAIVKGKIADRSRFVSFLKNTRKAYKLDSINLVLNSPQIQTFSVSVKGAGPLFIKEAVEKEFGLPAKDIVYDFKALGGNEHGTVLQATAMPKNISQEFINAFKQAGITVLSIESVGHALSRDLLPVAQEIKQQGTVLILSIDSKTTSLTYVVNGRVSQTTLLQFGDAEITEAIMKAMSVDAEGAEKLKREQGLIARDSRAVFDAIVDDCAALVHHVNQSYIDWKTMHSALPALEFVCITGAGSAVKGLDEYISAGLRVPVRVGNVWVNCLSFDEHIPAMPQSESLRYGAAIGVTLVGPHMTNLVPGAHARSLRRKHAAKVSAKIILAFILGVAVGVAVARVLAIPAVHSKIVEVLHKIPTRW
jgi:type IV pilus assembly protein PilM